MGMFLQERMANMLNDFEISPTNYMLAFLRQRGWLLPNVTTTIPNIIPEVEPETEMVSGTAFLAAALMLSLVDQIPRLST